MLLMIHLVLVKAALDVLLLLFFFSATSTIKHSRPTIRPFRCQWGHSGRSQVEAPQSGSEKEAWKRLDGLANDRQFVGSSLTHCFCSSLF